MTKPYDVITLMDVCVDLIVRGGDIRPRFGQAEQLVGDYALELGGSCCIFAAQAAKLQLNTVGVGIVGDDPLGEIVVNRLRQSGVIMDHVRKDANYKTGIGIALCDANDRAILTYSGSIDALGPHDIPIGLFERARHLHIGSYYLMRNMQPHYKDLVQKAKQHGMTVSLDTNWDPDERWEGGLQELLPWIDIFLPNVNELMAIAKRDTLKEAVQALQDIVPLIVVKDGAQGAYAYRGDQVFRSEPLRELHIVDSVGAGDSFDAGFVYGFLSGYDVETCLRIGCLCGGRSTTESGGLAGQIRLEDFSRHKLD